MMNFKFWYESNSCWGMVNSLDDLVEKLNLQIDPNYGGLKTVDEFLDKSMQCFDGSMNFGTRSEHSGEKSLRTFLKENDILDGFLNKIKDEKVHN